MKDSITEVEQGIAQLGQSAAFGARKFEGSNPSTLTKFCNKCKLHRYKKEFSWRNKSKGTLQSICKFCFQEQDNLRWKTDPSRRKSNMEKNNFRRKRNKKFVAEYLKKNPCVDCGEQDIIVLDFDHQRDKKYTISTMIRGSWSLKSIKEEIDKCLVRCANCHRRKTAKDWNWSK